MIMMKTHFRLSEGFDIGVKGEQEGEAAAEEEAGTDYEDSNELRSLPSDTEAEGSSARSKNVCWFNPATNMDDPQFKLGNAFVLFNTHIVLLIEDIYDSMLCSFLPGMKFANIKILRNAVVQYSVKNSRQLRYVKNMRT